MEQRVIAHICWRCRGNSDSAIYSPKAVMLGQAEQEEA